MGWLSLAQLISWGSVFYAFTLIMGPLEHDLGLTRAQSSLAFSLALLAEGLMAYPVGRWIDRGHERAVMTAGSVLAGLCLLAHGWVTHVVGLYAVWVGLGLAMAAMLYAPVFAVVTRRFPHDFRRAIITMTFLGGLASTVFIPLTAWLIAQFGWRHAMMALAMLHLLVCAPLHAIVLRGAPRPAPIQPKAAAEKTPGLMHHLTSTPFLLIGAFVVLMMSVTVALPAHMVSLLREHGLAASERAALMALVKSLTQEQGGRASLSVLYTEHNMDAVFGVADRVLVLIDGEIAAQGDPQAIARNPRVRQRYLGHGWEPSRRGDAHA